MNVFLSDPLSYALTRVANDLYYEPVSMTSISISEQSEIHAHLATINIRSYDGTTDVDEWLAHLTQVAALAGWDRTREHVLVTGARRSLKGGAANDFAIALNNSGFSLTYWTRAKPKRGFVQWLLFTYGRTIRLEARIKQWEALRIKDGQTASSWISTIDHLARRVNMAIQHKNQFGHSVTYNLFEDLQKMNLCRQQRQCFFSEWLLTQINHPMKTWKEYRHRVNLHFVRALSHP